MNLLSLLKKQRKIELNGEIDDYLASSVVSKLLDLSKRNSEEIILIINSSEGSVTAAFAIFDTMNFINCDVRTVVSKEAHGMAAFIAIAGTKGKRNACKDSVIGFTPFSYNDSNDRSITEKLKTIEKKVISIISNNTGQNYDKIEKELNDGIFISSEEAIMYGAIDKII